MTSELRQLSNAFTFTESPRWHNGQFWFVDLFSHRVLTIAETGEVRVEGTLEGYPGGLGFMPDATTIVVSQLDCRLLKIRQDGSIAEHMDLSNHARGGLNDMLIDRQGRIYVGHFGYDIAKGAQPQPASLLLVLPDGAVSEVADNLSFPNGLALSADGKTLVVAETFGHQLTAFDVRSDGSLSNRYTWASLPDHYPDGICMDADDGVWVGCTRMEKFVRVEKGGHISNQIDTPGRWAIACALGGPNQSKLFCATAETTQERMATGDSRGFVEIADLAPPF